MKNKKVSRTKKVPITPSCACLDKIYTPGFIDVKKAATKAIFLFLNNSLVKK